MPNQDAGTSTPSDRVRKAHRKFLANSHPNPRPSLKQFVNARIEEAKKNKDDSANDEKEWKLNKAGSKNQEKAQSTLKRITEEKLASRSAGKKK